MSPQGPDSVSSTPTRSAPMHPHTHPLRAPRGRSSSTVEVPRPSQDKHVHIQSCVRSPNTRAYTPPRTWDSPRAPAPVVPTMPLMGATTKGVSTAAMGATPVSGSMPAANQPVLVPPVLPGSSAQLASGQRDQVRVSPLRRAEMERRWDVDTEIESEELPAGVAGGHLSEQERRDLDLVQLYLESVDALQGQRESSAARSADQRAAEREEATPDGDGGADGAASTTPGTVVLDVDTRISR